MWSMAKRVSLFLLTNILIYFTLSVTLGILQAYFGVSLQGYSYLLVIAVVFGMGGAIISLFMSKWMAKKFHGVQIIDPNSRDPHAAKLVQTVHRLAQAANLPKMPEVGIYDSPEVNAFATGPSKSDSLVAVSSGLLQKMTPDEVEGVLGHEIAHIANGDMVTMTLLQGVINTLVIFLANILARVIVSQMRDERGGGGFFMYFAIRIVLEIILTLLGSMVVAAFSRYREFRADAGGAKFAGRQKMIAALERLRGQFIDNEDKAFQSMKISGHRGSALAALMATHPSLDVRIERLRQNR